MKKESIDLTHYFVVGPENVKEGSVVDVVDQAIAAGFRCIQIRAKQSSAKAFIQLVKEVTEHIEKIGKRDTVCLLVNDRLDVALACLQLGIKVDGIHVGQSDIPPAICRHFLGEDAIIGLSASTQTVLQDIKTWDLSDVDYLGVAPLHPTQTKPEAGYDDTGHFVSRTLEEIQHIKQLTHLPLIVGGGVTVADLPDLIRSGASGYFVVSAITQAHQPKRAALELVETWTQHDKGGNEYENSFDNCGF